MAVDGFFALSGYFLFSSVTKHTPVEYLTRRFLRLFPLLFLFVLLTAAIVSVIEILGFVRIKYFDLLSFIYTNLDLININRQYEIQGLFRQNPVSGTINGSLWTLNLEFWSAILLLAYVLLFRPIKFSKRGRLLTAIPLVFFVIYCELQHETSQGNLRDYWFRLLPAFTFGYLVHFFERSFDISLNRNTALILSSSIFLILFASIITNKYINLSIFIFALLLIPLKSLFPNLREPKYDTAYGIFIFGFPVTQILVLCGLTQPLVLGVVSSIICHFCSISFYQIFERHFNFQALQIAINAPQGENIRRIKRNK